MFGLLAGNEESACLLRVHDAMKTEDVRNRIQEGSEQLEEQGRAAMERAKDAVAVIGEYVHEKPWLPIGAVAAVALLLGFLIGQRQR